MAVQSDDGSSLEIARLYDYVPSYESRGDVPFFVDAACAAGSPVLEIGCGTGRVLIPTARAGVEVFGIDLSAASLEVCRENLMREPEPVRSRVQIQQADMRSFSLGERFRLAMAPFRVFHHMLTLEDQLAALAAIRAHLGPDGRLLLDIYNPSIDALANMRIAEEYPDQPAFTLPDSRRVQRFYKTVDCDRFRQIHHFEMIYQVTALDGSQQRLVHPFWYRYIFRYEAEHLLERAGFALESLYADYQKNPYGSQYPGELLLVARKR